MNDANLSKGTAIPSRSSYAIAATVIFLIEVAIAAFVHDGFIRPHLGDSLAVILVYLAIRATTCMGAVASVATAFAIACAIEFGQYIGLVALLGLEQHMLARIVLGTGFDPADFVAYAGGAVAVLVGEAALRARRNAA
jgi:hypothetical protein